MTCMSLVQWNHITGRPPLLKALTLRMAVDTWYDNPQVDDMHEFSRVEPYYWSTTTQALTLRMDTLYDYPKVDMTCMSLVE